MNIKFEVKMTKKAMFDFMLYTSYTSLSGIIGVIFGGVTLVLGIRQCMFGSYSTAATFFLFAAIFLIGNPLHLKARAAEQVMRSPMFQKPISYELNEEGIRISQDEQSVLNEWGYELGQHAKPGQVFTLVGDLGVGKTVFTKGLAAGLGITEPVSSPTFTIVQVYDEGRLPFYHFDVYRIGDVEEMDEIGYEDYVYGEGVSLIEWANLIEEILPEHFTEIKIEKNLEKGFDYRRISICEF